tara:strand:+ start:681 stop:1007 length:327 start_codon:yes stop_codon:yes gene_type:complete
MNEEKLNPMLSYDSELKKPKLINDDAVRVCVNYINNKEKTDVDFNVDDLFYDYMAAEGYYNPSQNEVNEFIWKMVKECSDIEEEELEPLAKTLNEKAGIRYDDNGEQI